MSNANTSSGHVIWSVDDVQYWWLVDTVVAVVITSDVASYLGRIIPRGC